MFLAALDITVNVALPDITASFGTDAVTIQWIIIFYVGASTALQLGLGGAADVFGLKRMFVIGLVVYTVAVVAIGLAQSLALVFGLRVLQAFGNGLLMALAPAIVTRLFPPDFRGRALGIMAALGTFGMMTGSLGGGLLVDELGWRAIFLGRLPICLAAIAFSVAFLRLPPDAPDAADEGAFTNGRPRSNFDVWGAATLFVAVSALILALALGGRAGWTQPYVPALFAVAVAAFVAFVAIERRAARPALDLSIFRNRALVAALAVSILAMVSTFVNWFILPFMVVDAMGASASVWGALLLAHDRRQHAGGAVGRLAFGPMESGVHNHRRVGYVRFGDGVLGDAGRRFGRCARRRGAGGGRSRNGAIPVRQRQPDNGRDAPAQARHGRRRHGADARTRHCIQRRRHGRGIRGARGGARRGGGRGRLHARVSGYVLGGGRHRRRSRSRVAGGVGERGTA